MRRFALLGGLLCLLVPVAAAQDEGALRARLDSLARVRSGLDVRVAAVAGEIAAAQEALALALAQSGGGVVVTASARSASVYASMDDEEPFARATPGDSLRAFAWEPGTEGTPFWLRVLFRGRMGYVAGSLTRPLADGAGALDALPGYGVFAPAASSLPATGIPDVPPAEATPSAPAGRTARTYYVGPRGGCYYLSDSGRKVYVDHSYCNR